MFRIGIDLDNTLIDYREVVKKLSSRFGPVSNDKNEIKKNIFSNNELALAQSTWCEFQSECYGERISDARIYDYALDGLEVLKNRGCEIYIVSHKTEQSYCNRKIPLRLRAKEFLHVRNVVPHLIPDENVHFEETLEDKIEKINALDLDFFIDDLYDVVCSGKIKARTIPILLNSGDKIPLSFEKWENLNKFLQLFIEKSTPFTVDNFGFAGKKRVCGISDFAYKFYDNSERLEREKRSLHLLHLLNVPQVVESGSNYILMDKIVGVPFQESDGVDDILVFLKDMDEIYLREETNLTEGTNNRRSYQDYIDNVELRYFEIKKSITNSTLDDLVANTILRFKRMIDECDLCLTKEFNSQELTYCYSDLSRENMLKKDNEIFFLDFECAGIDDPAKMIADFIHHPKNNFTVSFIGEFIRNYSLTRTQIDPSFSTRLRVVLNIIGFEWLLIRIKNFPLRYIELIERYSADNHFLDCSMIAEIEALIVKMSNKD